MTAFHARLIQGTKRRAAAGLRRELRSVPADALDLASNDYLGFARHPQIVQAAIEATRKFGSGARASRLISGNLDIHQQLESALANFKQCESALLFSSGYAANLAVVNGLAQSGDAIFCDKRNHASLVDACKLASGNGASVRYYSSLQKLRFLLESARGNGQFFVVSDAVYSMDGDLADVPALLKICEEFDAVLLLDDAHGTGTLGANGRGAIEHFGLELSCNNRVIQIGTLSKALGAQGGFVAGAQIVIDYLINGARPFVYSTALNPSACGAALAALEISRSQPQHLARLREVKKWLAHGLNEIDFAVRLNDSPILPVIVGEANAAVALSEELLKNGIWCPAIRPPTVRAGQSRLRVTASAALLDEDVSRALAAFARAKKYA